MNRSRTTAGPARRKRRPRWRTAATSDRHDLYERSVQDPGLEVDFIDQVWRERRRRLPRTLREDFCGTAAVAMAWVRRRPGNRAIGVDLDASVLDWGRARLPRRLKPRQRPRLTLLQADVRTVRARPVDCIAALNFSYFIFKTRSDMRRYFRHACNGLAKGGMFILDAYGGSDSFVEMKEDRDFDGFTYIWDQALYNPISGEVVNHIHFQFPDGTKMKNAFTYDWRLWTLPELRELLLEAGFRTVTVYWEGTDEDTGEGNGEYSPSTRGEACPGWVAYIVAEK